MKKIVILLYLICFSSVLAGCWDLDENERMYYVHGAGIDYKDGLYEVSLQIISFSNVAKSDQVNQDAIQSEVTTFTGKTPDEAFSKHYNALDEKVFWGHFSFIVFGQDALKDNRLNAMINDVTRYSDTRYNTWVYTTKEPLKDLLIALPLLKRSITLTKLADPLNSFEQQSYVEPINIRKLILHLNEPGYEVNIPFVEFKSGWMNQKGMEDQTIEIGGVGIISKNEFKGIIKNKDADGLKWVSKETISARVTSTFENNEPFSATANDITFKIEPIMNGNDVKFDINVTLTASLGSFTGKVNATDIKKAVSKQIKKEIEDTYKKGLEMDVDIYELSEVLYRKNLKLFKKLENEGKIELTEDSIRNIEVDVQKVETGRKSFEETIE